MILIAIAVAFLAGFFASTHPDGLEKVLSGDLADRTVSAIAQPPFLTVLAGIAGVILIYFIFRSIANIKYLGELLKKLLNIR